MREFQSPGCKQNWRDGYLIWVSAFANGDRGSPVIGCADAGRAAGTAEPVFVLGDRRLRLTFPFDEAYLRVISGAGAGAREVTTEVTTEVAPVDRLLSVMTGAQSRRGLQDALGLRNDEHFRKAYFLPALQEGYIAMTNPEKPTSRLQRYVLTEAGAARLKALKGSGQQ